MRRSDSDRPVRRFGIISSFPDASIFSLIVS
jgi:hypothetical protein